MEQVKIWNPHLVWIAPSAKIGKGTSIGNFVEVGKDVVVGEGCKIQAFVFIPKGVVIGSNVFIGPSVIFTNDRYPNSDDYGKFESTTVEHHANIGAGSTIRCGVTLGSGCTIGAGSVVVTNIPAGETWVGNPARRLR